MSVKAAKKRRKQKPLPEETAISITALNIFEPDHRSQKKFVNWMRIIRKKLVFEIKGMTEDADIFKVTTRGRKRVFSAKKMWAWVKEQADKIRLWPPQSDAFKKGLYREEVIGDFKFLKSMVIASKTGTGKTKIAELSGLKTILELGKKVLYLVPLRALAREKEEAFRETWGDIEKEPGTTIQISNQYGDVDESRGSPTFAELDFLVTTNEKADSLIRRGNAFIQNLGLVVVDEGDFITEKRRGPTLEAIIARVRQLPRNAKVQILFLSATIPIRSVISLAEWINSRPDMNEDIIDEIFKNVEHYYIHSDWRPIPLSHAIYVNGSLFYINCKNLPLQISSSKELAFIDNPLHSLVYFIIKEGGQVVVFASSRRTTAQLAVDLAAMIEKRRLLTSRQADFLSKFTIREYTRVERVLKKSVKKGVAFHHAGIHTSSLKRIETIFRKGFLPVIVATTTLSRGINLPARGVILNDTTRYYPDLERDKDIAVREYHQFVGRAGRPGKEEFGMGITMAETEKQMREIIKKFICAESELLYSQFYPEPPKRDPRTGLITLQPLKRHHVRALRYHILATIAILSPASLDNLHNFIGDTYLARTTDLVAEEEESENPWMKARVQDADRFWVLFDRILEYLIDENFVDMYESDGEDTYTPTPKGRLTTNLLIDPESVGILEHAARIFEEEEPLMKGINIDLPYLQLLSFIEDNHYARSTPSMINRGWRLVKAVIEAFAGNPKKKIPPNPEIALEKTFEGGIPSMEAVYEEYMNEWLVYPPDKETDPKGYERWMQALFTAMVMRDWINEIDEDIICKKFLRVQPGDIFRKHENTSRMSDVFKILDQALFHSNIDFFASEMYWRLIKGIKPELISLCRIRDIGRVRGRRLYNVGVKNRPQLIEALKTPEGRAKIKDVVGKVLTEKLVARFKRPIYVRRIEKEEKALRAKKLLSREDEAKAKKIATPAQNYEDLKRKVLRIIKAMVRKSAKGHISKEQLLKVCRKNLKISDYDFDEVMEELLNDGVIKRESPAMKKIGVL
jgi:helicase